MPMPRSFIATAALDPGYARINRRCLLLLIVLSVLGLAPAARAANSLSWSAPELVDHQYPYAQSAELTGVACPSSGLCVAVDSYGNVVTTTNPTGGASAWTTQNVKPNIEGINGFTGRVLPDERPLRGDR